MQIEQNNREDIIYQAASYQLEITELQVPLLATARKRIRKPRTLTPTEPPLFTNKVYEMMATGAPVISATQAYIKQPEWHEYSSGKLYFQKRFGKGRYIEFYILNKQEQQPEFIVNRAEEEILDRYGVMAARLHAVFATYAARQKHPWDEPFSLLGSDLIKILRLNSRKDMTKSEKLNRIIELAWIVGTLGVAVHWREGQLDLRITRTSPVWTILYIEEYHQPEIPGLNGYNELYDVVIRVQPGAWAEKFLNKTGSQAGLALHQYGFIHEKFFDLNPYNQKLAVALALYVLQNQRAHPNGKYRILTLLEAILSKAEVETISRDRKKRSRFIKQFHKLLLALIDAEFHISFCSSYPEEIQPVWATLPNESSKIDPAAIAPLNSRAASNCFETWLDSVVTITPPPTIEARTASFKAEKTKKANSYSRSQSKKSNQSDEVNVGESELVQPLKPSPTTVELTGSMVQSARQSSGFTQAHIASLIGKSVSWVKLIETGRRKIQPNDQQALRKFLNL
ncbi:MAG: XRE family transcriptional regulator [Rhizonema sp. PD38]|nr:XRE family transcriptional regulator [Rhizonema sp. PD38]